MKIKSNKENQQNLFISLKKGPSAKPPAYGNCVIMASALSHNNKILRLRKNMDQTDRYKILFKKQMHSSKASQMLQTVCARRVSLHNICSKESKRRSVSSGIGEHEEQSNFQTLKNQAKRLDQDPECSENKWRANNKFSSEANPQDNWQNIPISLSTLRQNRNKKCNMRRIIKGRPQISKILNTQNNSRSAQTQNQPRPRRKSQMCLQSLKRSTTRQARVARYHNQEQRQFQLDSDFILMTTLS